MSKSRTNVLTKITTASAVGTLLAALGCATPPAPYRGPDADVDADERWSAFAPQPSASNTEALSYAAIDDLMTSIVINMGMSLRQRLAPPPSMSGTRIRRGHTSSVWQEGNKVIFRRLDDRTKAAMRVLTDALAAVSKEVEITTLSRNEQLAYWYNLHNLLVVTEIAERYPVRKPSRLLVGPEQVYFHDAKLVTIKGRALSLRDIRVNIVQRYWSDPRVIYGFFHGDLASPSLLPRAWSADRVAADLDATATEFVNALRGVDRLRDKLLVSPIYREAQETHFSRWPEDFLEHLAKYAKPEAAGQIARTQSVEFAPYLERTADLTGGERQLSMNRINGQSELFGAWWDIDGVDVPNARPYRASDVAERVVSKKLADLRHRGRREKVYIIDPPDQRSSAPEVVR